MSYQFHYNPIKVVWLCHFANQEMKEYFDTPNVNEFAPWISALIELIKKSNEIELHIVTPNVFTNRDCDFKKDGITYHFYKSVPIPYNNSFFKRLYYGFQIESITNYFWIKKKIIRAIKQIAPNMIHLHGAENAYYSAGILPLIGKYPILTTIQGFIRNSSDTSFNIRKRIAIEEEIIRRSNHFGVRTDEMSEIVKVINPLALLHLHNYPLEMPSEYKDNIGEEEPIDCLFFARVEKDKGIEDLLAAISIIKQSIPAISVTIIGDAASRYLAYLKNMCLKLDIAGNVQFEGFLPTQEDIYPYLKKSKICVLPTYHDILPGTILLSMFMKLPVVAYAVGGLPELNIKDETILLAEKQNIYQLAELIMRLLNNVSLREILAEKAYKYASIRFDNSRVISDITNAYLEVLKADRQTVPYIRS